MSVNISISPENIPTFYGIFHSISSIISIISISLKDNKIHICNMDESHIALINVIIKKTFFSNYEISEKNTVITFNVLSFIKVLNCFMKSEENLVLTLSETELEISNGIKAFTLMLLSDDNDEIEIPETDYPVSFEIKSSAFKNDIKDLSIYPTETFDFSVSEGKVFLCSETPEGKTKIFIKEIDDKNTYFMSYNLKYFEKFCKHSLTEDIKLYLDLEIPMIYEIKSKNFRIRYYLSSLIKEE